MQEKDPFNPENHAEKQHEVKETHEHKITPAEQAKAEQKKDEILSSARQEATVESADKQKVLRKIEGLENQREDDFSEHLVNSDLKQSTFQKEMTYVRRKLTPTEKLASKVIHQPVVKTVSNVSSKTITRASGLLGGGLVAFLGTSVYLYLTKDIGLKYNYSVFIVLLILGFAIGVVLELLVRLITRQRKPI